jgi:hypothetical protein
MTRDQHGFTYQIGFSGTAGRLLSWHLRRWKVEGIEMTTRRRLLLFGMLAGLLVLGAGVWLFWPRPGITRENAAKIQPGMTIWQVEHLLGGPARDESTDQLNIDITLKDAILEHLEQPRLEFDPEWDWLEWKSNTVRLELGFTLDGRVAFHVVLPLCPAVPDDKFIDRVRRWCGL